MSKRTFHVCDHCGVEVPEAEVVPLVVGRPPRSEGYGSMTAMLWGHAPAKQPGTFEHGEFEFCLACGRALSLALHAAKLAVKRSGRREAGQ